MGLSSRPSVAKSSATYTVITVWQGLNVLVGDLDWLPIYIYIYFKHITATFIGFVQIKVSPHGEDADGDGENIPTSAADPLLYEQSLHPPVHSFDHPG